MATSAILGLNSNATHGFASEVSKTMATSGSNENNSSSDSNGATTISSSDFLTLLVTEMKNQDPTANQDPNEYINQLVQVNSLEQLISINQVLTDSLGSSESTSKSKTTPDQIGAGNDSKQVSSLTSSAHPSNASTTAGNLGIPAADPAAERIANSLNRSKTETQYIAAGLEQ